MQIHAPCLTEAYLDHNLYLGLDLLTSGSMAAEFLPWTISLPTLVLIARAVFLLEHGQTDRQTDRQRQLNAPSTTPAAIGYSGRSQ